MDDLAVIVLLGYPLWMWGGFLALVLSLVVFDLCLLHRKPAEISLGKGLLLFGFFLGWGLLFGAFIWSHLGAVAASEYFTGFVVEKSLAIDNIFVIALIFAYLGIPAAHQHRVLFWGILGVLVLRGVMIAAGAALLDEFSWVLYVFAVFLVYTGVKLIAEPIKSYDIASNPALRAMRRFVPISEALHGNKFLVRLTDQKTGRSRIHATPLLVALVAIEVADIIFAVDSVPAVFAITSDAFIVYTSNIFAILGLRALYFTLAAAVNRFALISYALSAVLVFIGGKVIVVGIFDLEAIPPVWSLAITLTIFMCGAVISWLWTRRAASRTVDHVEPTADRGLSRPAVVAGPLAGPAGTSVEGLSEMAHNLSHFTAERHARVSVGDVAAGMSDRGLAVSLVVFSAPNLVPGPPGISTVLGALLLLIAVQLLAGRRTLWLPVAIARLSCHRASFTRFWSHFTHLARRVEGLTRRRGPLSRKPHAERVVGAISLVMAVILIFPIPFANWLPAAAVFVAAIGLAARDGLWILGGAVIALASVAVVTGVAGLALTTFRTVLG